MTKTHLLLLAAGVVAGYMLRDQLAGKLPLYSQAYSTGANLSTPAVVAS